MSKVLSEGNGVTSFGSVDGEEDLKLKAGININPPPEDGGCECCGKHISELKPFGKAGDPLVGDFNGALLVKVWRLDFPPNEEAESIKEEFYRDCHSKEDHRRADERLIQKYGKEEAEKIFSFLSAHSQVGAFWLCRDCIILSEDDFYGKLFPGYAANTNQSINCIALDMRTGALEARQLIAPSSKRAKED